MYSGAGRSEGWVSQDGGALALSSFGQGQTVGTVLIAFTVLAWPPCMRSYLPHCLEVCMVNHLVGDLVVARTMVR